MTIERQVQGRTLVLRPLGRLDHAAASELSAAGSEAIGTGLHHLVLDLGGVTQLAGAGLQAILALQQAVASRKGGRLAFAGASDTITATLRVAGLLALCPQFASVEQAVDRFDR